MRLIIWFSRVSLFVVYFWFGILKIVGNSPAEPLVHQLFDITLVRLIDFPTFLLWFGVFECLIAVMWLVPKLTYIAHNTTIFHVILTIVPIFALTNVTWTGLLSPTILGQYIMKNLLLLSCVMLVTHIYKLETHINHK